MGQAIHGIPPEGPLAAGKPQMEARRGKVVPPPRVVPPPTTKNVMPILPTTKKKKKIMPILPKAMPPWPPSKTKSEPAPTTSKRAYSDSSAEDSEVVGYDEVHVDVDADSSAEDAEARDDHNQDKHGDTNFNEELWSDADESDEYITFKDDDGADWMYKKGKTDSEEWLYKKQKKQEGKDGNTWRWWEEKKTSKKRMRSQTSGSTPSTSEGSSLVMRGSVAMCQRPRTPSPASAATRRRLFS